MCRSFLQRIRIKTQALYSCCCLYRPVPPLHRLCPARKRESNSEAGLEAGPTWEREEEDRPAEGGKACCFISPWAGDTMDKVKLHKTRRGWKSALVRSCDRASHSFPLPRVYLHPSTKQAQVSAVLFKLYTMLLFNLYHCAKPGCARH